jgi:DNA polymerase IV
VTIQSDHRLILHADMDAFFASVEILDHPELSTRPVVVGGSGRRGVVAAASYQARTFGVRSAMSMVEARKKCPNLVIMPPRFERYRALSKTIMSTFQEYSEYIEPLSIDEAFIDLTKSSAAQDPEAIARQLKAQVYEVTGGLTVSIGIGVNKFVAKIASDIDKPDGLVIIRPDETERFLEPLPVSRLWGAGPKTTQRLKALGLHTIGAIKNAPKELLQSFGQQGRRFRAFAHGVDERQVVSSRVRKSIGIETTLETDLWLDKGCHDWLEHASTKLSKSLERHDVYCAGIRLKIKCPKHQTSTRQTTLGHPTRDAKLLYTAAQHLCAPLLGTTKVRLIGLSVFTLSPPSSQLQLDI